MNYCREHRIARQVLYRRYKNLEEKLNDHTNYNVLDGLDRFDADLSALREKRILFPYLFNIVPDEGHLRWAITELDNKLKRFKTWFEERKKQFAADAEANVAAEMNPICQDVAMDVEGKQKNFFFLIVVYEYTFVMC